METIKNFAVGIFVAIIALICLAAGFFLWPVIVGITSVLLFGLVIVLVITLLFYIVVLVGYVVRKGFKGRK